MKHITFELIEPVNIRIVRELQKAKGRNQNLRGGRRLRASFEILRDDDPKFFIHVPVRCDDACIKDTFSVQIVLPRHLLPILLDLRLISERVRPIMLQGCRVRIIHHGDVRTTPL